MGLWRLILRLVVGSLLIGHGTQKLFGWFGGGGVRGTAEHFEKLGLRPGRPAAIAAGLAEAGGGAMIASGLEVPLAAAGVTATMLTAIVRVHRKNGPWSSAGGYEYNAVLIALVLALVETGPGRLSLDSLLAHRRSGAPSAAAAFGGGSLAAYAVDRLSGVELPKPVGLHATKREERAAA